MNKPVMPITCDECPYNGSCTSAMYLDGCKLYPPSAKSQNIFKKLIDKFKNK